MLSKIISVHKGIFLLNSLSHACDSLSWLWWWWIISYFLGISLPDYHHFIFGNALRKCTISGDRIDNQRNMERKSVVYDLGVISYIRWRASDLNSKRDTSLADVLTLPRTSFFASQEHGSKIFYRQWHSLCFLKTQVYRARYWTYLLFI